MNSESVLKFMKFVKKILSIFSTEKLLDNEGLERAEGTESLADYCLLNLVECWLSYSSGKPCSTAKAAAKVRCGSLTSRKQYSPITLSINCHTPVCAAVKLLLKGRLPGKANTKETLLILSYRF